MSIPCMAHADEAKTEADLYVAYLFTYFTGNHGDEEAVRYAVSEDGFNYKALNDNKPIIDSKEISVTGGVRDPHLLRGEDGAYYMVLTADGTPTVASSCSNPTTLSTGSTRPSISPTVTQGRRI